MLEKKGVGFDTKVYVYIQECETMYFFLYSISFTSAIECLSHCGAVRCGARTQVLVYIKPPPARPIARLQNIRTQVVVVVQASLCHCLSIVAKYCNQYFHNMPCHCPWARAPECTLRVSSGPGEQKKKKVKRIFI